MDTRLTEIGEFGFLKHLSQWLPTAPSVVEGIGDDCAVLRIGETVLLVSSDMFIENTHFRTTYFSPERIGAKAAARALSDIAAMGGKPLFCLVSLTCPISTSLDFLKRVYRGMVDVLDRYGACIVGGDTAARETGVAMDVVVIGTPYGDRYLTRRGASAGDVICVTGPLGTAGAGLYALERGLDAPEEVLWAHLEPLPKIEFGEWLALQPSVKAMIDVSDGLLRDVGHLGEATGIGVNIVSDRVPVTEATRQFCASHGLNAVDLAMTSGDDYELACAIAPNDFERVQKAFQEKFGCTLYSLGFFTDAWEGVRVDGECPKRLGYQHFSKG